MNTQLPSFNPIAMTVDIELIAADESAKSDSSVDCQTARQQSVRGRWAAVVLEGTEQRIIVKQISSGNPLDDRICSVPDYIISLRGQCTKKVGSRPRCGGGNSRYRKIAGDDRILAIHGSLIHHAASTAASTAAFDQGRRYVTSDCTVV